MTASKAATIEISLVAETSGLVKIDGIVVFRRLEKPDGVYLQFVDRDRMRSACRGTRYVEVPLSKLVQFLGGSQ